MPQVIYFHWHNVSYISYGPTHLTSNHKLVTLAKCNEFFFLGYSGAAKDDLYYDPSKTDLDIETSNTFADDQITIIHPTFYVNPTGYD